MLLAAQLTEVARRKADAERVAAEARIEMERAIQTASLTREQAVREAEITQARALEIAEQERAIQIAAKSQEENEALAQATEAKAQMVKAEEELSTLRQVSEAERRKQLALLAAVQEAEAQATRVRIVSESDKVAAKARGIIKREEAETLRFVKQAEADGEAARIAAENQRSPELVSMELEKARLAAMPVIVAEMVKPAEKIKGISINTINGLMRGSEGGDRPGSPVNQTVDAILDLAVSMPAMKKLGEAVGVNLEGILPAEKK